MSSRKGVVGSNGRKMPMMPSVKETVPKMMQTVSCGKCRKNNNIDNMYANKVKKVVAVHDLSGVGRVSLTVVIPILSSMGFQVCPLPTAVLSSHTQYPEFSFLDLTDEMPKIISEWKEAGSTV